MMQPLRHEQSNDPNTARWTPARAATAALAVLLLLLASLGGCEKSRNQRVQAWLQKRQFRNIALRSTNRSTWTFTANREGIDCSGSVKMIELKRGYNDREKIEGDWYCGQ